MKPNQIELDEDAIVKAGEELGFHFHDDMEFGEMARLVVVTYMEAIGKEPVEVIREHGYFDRFEVNVLKRRLELMKQELADARAGRVP